MNKHIVVFGAGLVGGAIAIDLKKNFTNVSVIDNNPNKLNKLKDTYGIGTFNIDFNNKSALEEAIKGADILVGAVPGALGYEILELAIRNRKDIVDISFCPEKSLTLDSLAKEYGVTVIVDMGVAPGMCNAILGYYNTQMQVHSYKCIVGGLPVKREWPFEYKASWSPIDVIEEYTRSARLVQNGTIISKPALSDMQLVNFQPIGTLEEWNSDGLRSLIDTMPHIPNMVEKTLRYPGTMRYIEMLRDTGFFSEKELEIGDSRVRPLDLTTRLLFPIWELKEDEEEFTAMRITINGVKNSSPYCVEYELFDRNDSNEGISSMARTTGYTCAGAVHLVLNEEFKRPGVNPPEFVGADERCFRFLLKYLNERSVVYKQTFS